MDTHPTQNDRQERNVIQAQMAIVTNVAIIRGLEKDEKKREASPETEDEAIPTNKERGEDGSISP